MKCPSCKNPLREQGVGGMTLDVHYYDKTFDLDKLRSVDLYLVTWGSPHIAHTMLSSESKPTV